MKYTHEVLNESVAKSRSYLEVLRNLGANGISSASYTHVKRKIQEFGVSTAHFSGKSWARGSKGRPPNNKLPFDEVLVVLTGNIRGKTKQLRRALVESGIPYTCSRCGLGSEWQGEMITLEIDHIDGNWRDCRKENLQFLCPNCHSQKGRTKINICSCGVVIPRKSKLCKSCNMKTSPIGHREKGIWPDPQELSTLVWKYPATTVASKIGVSSVMIKRRCKRLGISTPPRGYWARRAAFVEGAKLLSPSSNR